LLRLHSRGRDDMRFGAATGREVRVFLRFVK